MAHSHGGHRERLRNKFRTAPESLEDHELLELLLFYAIPDAIPTILHTLS